MRPHDLLRRLAGEEKLSGTGSDSSRLMSASMQIPESSRSDLLSSGLSSRPMSRQRDVQGTRQNVRAGQFWVYIKDDEAWPMVICDGDMVTRFNIKRPDNAHQLGSNWYAANERGTSEEGDRIYPCVNIATLGTAWIPMKQLEGFKLETTWDRQQGLSNPILEEAWKEAQECCMKGKLGATDNLAYWKDKLMAKHMQQEINGEHHSNQSPMLHPEIRKSTEKRKRRHDDINRENVTDDEEPGMFLNPKIKKEALETDAYYPSTGLFSSSRPSELSKRRKLNCDGSFPRRLGSPFSYRSSALTTPVGELRISESPGRTEKQKTLEADPNKVIIYVGEPSTRFCLTRFKLSASPKLEGLLHCDSETGWFIMSPLLSSMSWQDFQPVGHFLERQEYSPNLLDDGTDYARLEGNFTSATRASEIERCGTIHCIARQLEMEQLQNLSFRKLRALAVTVGTKERLSLKSILVVTRDFFQIASAELQQFLTQFLAEHFWDLVWLQTEKTREVMESINGLGKGVHAILAGQAPALSTVAKKDNTAKLADEVMDHSTEKGKDRGESQVREAEDDEMQQVDEDITAAVINETRRSEIEELDHDIVAQIFGASMADQSKDFLEDCN